MNEPLHTSISFDSYGFFALEMDGVLVSWQTPKVPEPPEEEITLQVYRDGAHRPLEDYIHELESRATDEEVSE